MASTAPTPVPATKFPIKLARELLSELLSKERKARFHSTSDANAAAFEELVATLPGRRDALVSQIAEAADDGRGFCRLVEVLWKFIRGHSAFEQLTPAKLHSSVWLLALTTILEATCAASSKAKGLLLNGNAIIEATIYGISGRGGPPLPPDRVASFVALMEWWSDEVVSKRWGVSDVWGVTIEDGFEVSVLHDIASQGLAAFVPLAVKRGCAVNGDWRDACGNSPAARAFEKGHYEAFEALLDHGADLLRPYDGNGLPLSMFLLQRPKGHLEFLAKLLKKRPAIITATPSEAANRPLTTLLAAVGSLCPEAVDLLLTSGAQLEYRCVLDGEEIKVLPTIAEALSASDPRMLELLIGKWKALEDWESKYDKTALGILTEGFTIITMSAYRPDPAYSGPLTEIVPFNPQGMECLKMVLATGFNWPWDRDGVNATLQYLYKADKEDRYGRPKDCPFVEEDVLDLLTRLHASGFDLVHYYAPENPLAANDGAFCGLTQSAACAGHPKVLDWAVRVLKAPVEPPVGAPGIAVETSPLFSALYRQRIPCALLLLEKYKVTAAYPDQPLHRQPVYQLMETLRRYTDEEGARVMRALVERDPDIFNIKCFDEASVAALEAKAVTRHTLYPWNPLFQLVIARMPKTLEMLLEKNPPGVAEMGNRRVTIPSLSDGSNATKYTTAAQFAARRKQWDCLGLLLRHTGVQVSELYGDNRSVAHLVAGAFASADNAPSGSGADSRPPRDLVVAVMARANVELRVKGHFPALARRRVGATTNSFVDPTPLPPLPPLPANGGEASREAKKKAKKKAAKRKARAKKRAAANAGAGGSASAAADDTDDSSSDDDDEEPFEEPDDNLVDSRNAPSLDLLLEQMGLRHTDVDADSGGSAGGGAAGSASERSACKK